MGADAASAGCCGTPHPDAAPTGTPSLSDPRPRPLQATETAAICACRPPRSCRRGAGDTGRERRGGGMGGSCLSRTRRAAGGGRGAAWTGSRGKCGRQSRQERPSLQGPISSDTAEAGGRGRGPGRGWGSVIQGWATWLGWG